MHAIKGLMENIFLRNTLIFLLSQMMHIVIVIKKNLACSLERLKDTLNVVYDVLRDNKQLACLNNMFAKHTRCIAYYVNKSAEI